MAEAVVRLQALDGTWETCGVDRLTGIVPQDVVLSANAWGSDTCSFTLRRDPGSVHPDLTAFTPCEVNVGGEPVWSGRVKETPTKDGEDPQISVQGEGWQYHLDDDVYERKYVHTRLSEWKDTRSFLDTDLTVYKQVGTVTSDGGIVIAFPAGTAVPGATTVLCGVTLDLGVDQVCASLSFDWESSNNSSQFTLVAENGDQPGWAAGTVSNIGSIVMNTGASGTLTADAAATRRYVHFYLQNTSGGSVTPSADIYMRITGARVFRSAAYRSGAASVLKASDVVKDARDAATQLLSTSNDCVTATTFSLEDLALDGLKTPREVISGVNAYHDYDTKVDVDKRLVFKPRPSAPLYEVGSWSGADFEDASANSGEDIYNRCIVEATDGGGEPLRVERWSPPVLDMSGFAQPANPSADVNAANWTASAGTFGRDTGTFHTSPASFGWGSGAGNVTSAGVTQALAKNRRYGLRVWILASGVAGLSLTVLDSGGTTTYATKYIGTPASGSFAEFALEWTQPAEATGYSIRISKLLGSLWFDTITVGAMRSTIVDRRAFRRTKILPVESALTEAGAIQLGDTYLTNHKATPFKGSLSVTGANGVRKVLGGHAVHPAHLLRETTEYIRFSHRLDPDTGNVGREGRIASVTYTHANEQASVQVDNERNNFEALLARLGAITGKG